MTKLEILKLRSQVAAVTAAKAEQEFQLEQKRQEIERLEKAIVIQDEKIKELNDLINKE